jgi:AraC-like DNA-binding protein
MNARLTDVQDWGTLAREANWSVAALAKRLSVSTETLRQYFLKHQGKPPRAWLLRERQRQAVRLLNGGLSVKQTALSLGYKQQTNFCRWFKKQRGHCPSHLEKTLIASCEND